MTAPWLTISFITSQWATFRHPTGWWHSWRVCHSCENFSFVCIGLHLISYYCSWALHLVEVIDSEVHPIHHGSDQIFPMQILNKSFSTWTLLYLNPRRVVPLLWPEESVPTDFDTWIRRAGNPFKHLVRYLKWLIGDGIKGLLASKTIFSVTRRDRSHEAERRAQHRLYWYHSGDWRDVGSREISRASGMDFQIPPSFLWKLSKKWKEVMVCDLSLQYLRV